MDRGTADNIKARGSGCMRPWMDTESPPAAPDRCGVPLSGYHTERSAHLCSPRRVRNFLLALGEGSVREGCGQWMICSCHGAASSGA